MRKNSKKSNRIITTRLNKLGARFLTERDEWKAFFPEIPIKTKKKFLKVRFSKKEGTKNILIPYPFYISKTTAYVFGLALGSAVKRKDRLILKLDPRQVSKIEHFCRQFQLRPKIKVMKKRYKQRGKQQYNRYFQDALIHVPAPIFNYLKALGFDVHKPKIPKYFHPDLKHQVITGYLNSKSTTIVHHLTRPVLNQWMQLKAKSNPASKDRAKEFASQIVKEFEKYEIKAELKLDKFHSKIIVRNREIAKLCKHYRIRRPQIRYSAKLVDLMNEYQHVRKTINAHAFNAFELTVLEIAFYHFYKLGKKEVEYTRFEEILCVSSNTIRQCLYDFQELGIIQYFAKGRKEFLRPTFLCFKNTEDFLKYRTESFKEPLEMGEGVSFECLDCGMGVGYSTAMNEGGNFCCPHCGSSDLEGHSEPEFRRHWIASKRELDIFQKSFEVMCRA